MRKPQEKQTEKQTEKPPKHASPPAVNFDPATLSAIMAETSQTLAPLLQDFMGKLDWPGIMQTPAHIIDPFEIQRAYAAFFQKLYENPERISQMQLAFAQDWMTLWTDSTKRFMGEAPETPATTEPYDKRFKSAAWDDSALFDFIKRSYLLTSRWINQSVHETSGLDPATQQKVEFFTRQFVDALSPSNFALTNPDVIQATLDSRGENLVRGFQNMLEDLERGHGQLRIRTTDANAFTLGENIATTPGQVVYQNDLMQLIQYEPATPEAFKTPLLIVPPWINKYYILDLRPDNSFVKWLVDQGHTVFILSWVNPDGHLTRKTFADYMREGILAALGHIETETGSPKTNIAAYCIGGTLLATTLAWMSANGQADRIASATFLTTLIDFRNSGDLNVFVDDAQIEALEKAVENNGLFDARTLKDSFSLLRANDLVWSFVVNNYLLGREPFPFDLLYWNDDSTNMPAAMHSFYLRNMYRDNKLAQPGGIEIDGTPIHISAIKTPAYFLSAREDHIAPWQATFSGAGMFSGPTCFTLSGSGHVAGVVNPPQARKYGFRTAPIKKENAERWLENAITQDGSWWPHWNAWLAPYAGEKIPARQPKNPLEPAPGSYVKTKAAI